MFRKASRALADAFQYPTPYLVVIFLNRSRGISSSKIAKVRSARGIFGEIDAPPEVARAYFLPEEVAVRLSIRQWLQIVGNPYAQSEI